MLTEKEKKFITTQRMYNKFFLIIGWVLPILLAILVYLINSNSNIMKLCGLYNVPPDIRSYFVKELECVIKFSITLGFAIGLCFLIFFCFLSSLALYINNRKWLGIVDKINF